MESHNLANSVLSRSAVSLLELVLYSGSHPIDLIICRVSDHLLLLSFSKMVATLGCSIYKESLFETVNEMTSIQESKFVFFGTFCPFFNDTICMCLCVKPPNTFINLQIHLQVFCRFLSLVCKFVIGLYYSRARKRSSSNQARSYSLAFKMSTCLARMRV